MIKLPEPAGKTLIMGDVFTADQLKQAILDALEEAAAAVEKATYRKRWAKAAVNGQSRNMPPCDLAAAIRKLKEDIQ